MLAEKANLFQDRRDEELIMSSSNPRAHKHVGRGVRNFYYHIWAVSYTHLTLPTKA